VKNANVEEPPLSYINRNPLWLLASVLISLIFAAFTVRLFLLIDPLAFLLMIPAGILIFQTIWMLLNPFAGIYSDKIVIKSSLFKHKVLYLVDIQKAGLNKKGNLVVEFHDGDTELIPLSGVLKSGIPSLLAAIRSGLKS
jgi:hypothetical protein